MNPQLITLSGNDYNRNMAALVLSYLEPEDYGYFIRHNPGDIWYLRQKYPALLGEPITIITAAIAGIAAITGGIINAVRAKKEGERAAAMQQEVLSTEEKLAALEVQKAVLEKNMLDARNAQIVQYVVLGAMGIGAILLIKRFQK